MAAEDGLEAVTAPQWLERVTTARTRIQPFIHRTPLLGSALLTVRLGTEVYLKAEPLQKTGSFKVRGILNKVLKIAEEGNCPGVITFSAGNAAQALAYAARCAGLSATVVMIPGASAAKTAATKAYGARIVHATPGQNLFELTDTIASHEGLRLVHPCDDVDVMTGHASLGMEILEDLPKVSAIVTAIGGGGMAGALSLVRRATAARFRLIGVEPEGAPHMKQSLLAGKAIEFRGTTIAEGLNPPGAGRYCYELARDMLERVVLVSDAQIVAAMRCLMQYVKLVVEPSGAAALAGTLGDEFSPSKGEPLAVIVSGGNVDLERLKDIL
jgi:threonine dehydratase